MPNDSDFAPVDTPRKPARLYMRYLIPTFTFADILSAVTHLPPCDPPRMHAVPPKLTRGTIGAEALVGAAWELALLMPTMASRAIAGATIGRRFIVSSFLS
jgi:hypothetical protein